MKDYSHLPFGIRQLRTQWRTFRLSLKNARKAFRPGEILYHLGMKELDGYRVAYRKGTSDVKVLAHSFGNDRFFPAVPEYQPQPNHIIIDIGAHIGGFALVAAKKVPQGQVFAIEACLEAYDYLCVNIAMNRMDNIKAHHLALTDQKGVLRLYHDDGNWGHSIMMPISPVWEETPSDTLTNYLAEQGLKSVDFIKMNCEGAEFPILMSTSVALLKQVGCMLIFYHADLSPRHTLADLRTHLENAGFKTRLSHQEDDRGGLVAYRDPP
ncbi:MAG: FkbM family methyltransferase [Magnetococcales bacterium]|nr:FkbM family methyltransferase [Magnetococcales bacterium]MBF0438217.1 FkbM family methyltransferase [Magnetococcales bacterium]